MQGMFITFEGGEGSGKSTQARLLAASFRALGHNVVETREPGGSPFAERVRGLILDPSTPRHSALAEALLFSAARSDHLETVIRPALLRGGVVISDRFADSTRVYQGGAGGLDDVTISLLEGLVVGDTWPALTMVLDLEARVGLERAQRRRGSGGGADGFEARDLTFHETLRRGFLALAAVHPKRIVVLDGSLGIDALATAVRETVKMRLGIEV